MNLFAELKRRNVFRVGLFYVVAAWLIVEVAETVLPLFDVPDGVLRGLVVLLVIGLVPALGLSWIYELTPEGIKRDVGASTDQAARTGHKLNWATLVVALLAIGLLAVDRIVPEHEQAPAAADGATITDSVAADRSVATDPASLAAPAQGLGDASVAVLPFADLSPAGDQEYFSDGIAEEILNALVKVEGLQVASRTSSFGFKGQENLGMRAVADALSVRHVLEGSVRRAGDTIRITAQLIDARIDRHLWSETFDRPLTAENIFAIQEEIATAIVAALVASLGIEAASDLSLSAPTENLTAYDLYLQARALFQARNRLDEADELLQQALEQDPDFAKAWELRAALQPLIREYGYSDLPHDELDRLNVEFAQRALEIDPASSMALASMAQARSNATMSLRVRHDIAEVINDLERALEIDPSSTSARNWLGIILASVGRTEEALAEFQRCMAIDPLFAPCTENEYDLLWVLGRPDEAFAHYQHSLARGAHTNQYFNFSLLAHFEQKTAFMIAANQSLWFPGWRRHDELYEAVRDPAGDHSALLRDLREYWRNLGSEKNGYRETVLVTLGAYELVPFALLIWGPDYAGYRRSPEFADYMRRSGVLEYWQAHGFPPQCRPAGEDDFECE